MGGGVGSEKYESILCLESGLICTLLNLAQFTRFRKHHFADGQADLVSPNLEFILFTQLAMIWVRYSRVPDLGGLRGWGWMLELFEPI